MMKPGLPRSRASYQEADRAVCDGPAIGRHAGGVAPSKRSRKLTCPHCGNETSTNCHFHERFRASRADDHDELTRGCRPGPRRHLADESHDGRQRAGERAWEWKADRVGGNRSLASAIPRRSAGLGRRFERRACTRLRSPDPDPGGSSPGNGTSLLATGVTRSRVQSPAAVAPQPQLATRFHA